MKANEINDYSKLLDVSLNAYFKSLFLVKQTKTYITYQSFFMKDTIKLEDLQLWYSILLQAKDDFYIASSKADHLVMIFLE